MLRGRAHMGVCWGLFAAAAAAAAGYGCSDGERGEGSFEAGGEDNGAMLRDLGQSSACARRMR